jgi:hypothetical protein
VVSTYGIAGTKALSFQSGPENWDKTPCDFDKTAQRALIACGGVNQDPALNRLPRDMLEHINALLQCAGRVSLAYLGPRSIR